MVHQSVRTDLLRHNTNSSTNEMNESEFINELINSGVLDITSQARDKEKSESPMRNEIHDLL